MIAALFQLLKPLYTSSSSDLLPLGTTHCCGSRDIAICMIAKQLSEQVNRCNAPKSLYRVHDVAGGDSSGEGYVVRIQAGVTHQARVT